MCYPNLVFGIMSIKNLEVSHDWGLQDRKSQMQVNYGRQKQILQNFPLMLFGLTNKQLLIHLMAFLFKIDLHKVNYKMYIPNRKWLHQTQ